MEQKQQFNKKEIGMLINVFSKLSFSSDNWKDARDIEDLKNKAINIFKGMSEDVNEAPSNNIER